MHDKSFIVRLFHQSSDDRLGTRFNLARRVDLEKVLAGETAELFKFGEDGFQGQLVLLANWLLALLHSQLTAFLLFPLHKQLKTFPNQFIVEALEFGGDLGQLLVVCELFGDRVLPEVYVCEAGHAAQVLDLVHRRDAVALQVQYGQVLAQTDVEQVFQRVIRNVELLQLLEGLDTLHLG